MEILSGLLFLLIVIPPLIFIAAVIFAFIGYFSKTDKEKQAKNYALAAKALLLSTLITLIGLGSCFALISSSGL